MEPSKSSPYKSKETTYSEEKKRSIFNQLFNRDMEDVYFREKQIFNQWWLWLIIGGSMALMGWGLIQQLIIGIPFGNNPAPDIALIFIAALVFGLMGWIASMNLNTKITDEGIHVKFAPFINRLYAWEDIDQVYVRKYMPLKEFGGWGYRFGPSGMALNMSGNHGIQIVLKSGQKVLIGTQKPDEAEEVLARFGYTGEHV
ncbi:MAG: hypothetical protein AAFO07_21275 [Bacteroidota bacterium]